MSTVTNCGDAGTRPHCSLHKGSSEFVAGEGGRACVQGLLSFTTVTALLPAGSAAIESGQVSVVDFSGVTAGDSAGLALLIEWLSLARAAGRALRYENVPSQLLQLARVSEVEGLLQGTGPGAESPGILPAA